LVLNHVILTIMARFYLWLKKNSCLVVDERTYIIFSIRFPIAVITK
jgi:hypothetical protein